VLATNNIFTTANISSKTLTVVASGVNKTYDGTTNATVTLSDNRVSGDNLTVNYTTASFADKNVGNSKTVSVSGISVSGADAGDYSLANTTATTPANITTRALTVTATGVNKAYDNSTAATVSLSDNRISGDSLTDTYSSAAFADKNVGTAKTINISGIQITGSDSANYYLSATTASTTANISGRVLTVVATGVDKAYDGTTSATVSLSDNRLSGDTLTVNYGSATFATKAAGSVITVTVSNLTLSGASSGNYSLASTNTTTTANITARALAISATGINKNYDGTASASVTLSDNRIAGDSFTDSYSAATFSDKSVGNGKSVSVSGLSISGADSSNYSLTNYTAVTTANITARSLTVTATGINKAYDGTTNATVTLSDNRIAGDSLTDTYTAAAFTAKNVGTSKTVNVSGIQITGTDSGNYTLTNTTASATANITARTLSVAATGVDKIYDHTTSASVSLSDNRLSGDSLTVNYGSANFASKAVGSGISITVSNLTLSGSSSANYSLAATNISATANITARSLTVTATGVNKTYDGTTAATVTLSDNRIAGDVFTDTYGSANFSSSAVGNGKAVSVSGIYISGTDAGNYSLSNTTAATTANILAAGSSLAFNASLNPAGYLANVSYTATLPSDATGTVTLFTNGISFASGAPVSGTFAANLASLPRGTNLITAIYSGDSNYSAATNSFNEVITNHPPQTGYFSFSVTNGVSLKVSISSLLSAVIDADSDSVSLVSVSKSTNGMNVYTNSTLLLFQNTNYLNDSFSYVVTDHFGGYATGQVYVASVLAPFTGQNTSLFAGGSSNVLTFHGIPFYTYTVQRSVNLLTWKSISTNTANNIGAINYTDNFADLSGPPSSAFYRLLWQPN
jgi:predicted permease